MLSRVAANVYWLNRYLERAENYARFLDVGYDLALERRGGAAELWRSLVAATGDLAAYHQLHPTPTKQSAIHFLALDERNGSSIYSAVLRARENARAIRSEITREVWEEINQLHYFVREAAEAETWKQADPRPFFEHVKRSCQRTWGLYESTVSKYDGWHFSRLGRLVERADKTSRILDLKYLALAPDRAPAGSNFDLVQWASLLKSVSAFDMYKKKYGKLAPRTIVEFLIFDRRFPRSIYSCLLGAGKSLKALSPAGEDRLNPVQRKLGLIRSHLEFSEVDDIIEAGVHEYLDKLQRDLNALSTQLFETFFSVEAQLERSETTPKSGAAGAGMTQSQS